MEENTTPNTETHTTPEQKTSPETTQTNSKTPFYLAVIIIVIAGAVGAYIAFSGEKENTNQDASPDTFNLSQNTLTEEEAAEAIAYVNGVAVTRGQVAESVRQLTEQARFSGIDVSLPGIQNEINTEARNIAINNELLRQEAEAVVGVPATEELEGTLAQIKEDSGGDEAFAAALQEINLTEEELKKNLKDSLMIEDYLETRVEEVVISEEQILQTYNEYGGEEAGLPPLADVSGQIEEQLIQEDRNEQIRLIIEELTEAAEITEA